MAQNRSFLEGGDAEFDQGLDNLVDYVVEKTSVPSGAPPEGTPGGTSDGPAWTHIPQPAVDGLVAVRAAWRAAYQKTFGAHTPVETEAKNDARKAATAVVRPFIAQYLMFAPVTNEDRSATGVHNKDLHPSQIGEPKTRPLITDLRALGGFQVKIWFRDEATPESRAIPYGFNGCLLCFTWGKEKATHTSQLNQTVLMTHSPFIHTLPPEAQANFLSCATRWQNEKGELGPWSDIHYVVVG